KIKGELDGTKEEIVSEPVEEIAETFTVTDEVAEDVVEEEPKSKRIKLNCDKNDCKKALLIGAGVAAAIGLIYLLFKDKKDN
ncbi:MAG: hypothetical protein IJC20_02055, partial [Clostridia bacterium]|nr:hypothetical protein [Clostridia bacterium]